MTQHLDAFEITEVAQLEDGVESAAPGEKIEPPRQVLRQTVLRMTRQISDAELKAEEAEEDAQHEMRSFLLNLVTVIDSLDRMIRGANQTNDLVIGIDMTRRQFLQTLEEVDLELIEVNPGDCFDAQTCEISQAEQREDLAENTIIFIDRRGYRWKGKTLRRARVTISKH